MAHDWVYLDTNIFIALRETNGVENKLLWDILASLRDKARPFQTSLLTFSELKVRPLRLREAAVLATYEEWSQSNDWPQVCTVSRSVLEGAALLRAHKASLKLPDAIHLATALHLRRRYFLTADQGIQDSTVLEHPVEGLLDIQPLVVLRPDEPTLTALFESLAS